MDELEGIVQELLNEGRDDAYINEVVSMYEQQNSQPTETTGEVVEDTEEGQTNEEFETERAAKEEGYRAAHAAIPGAAAVVAQLPDFLLEPYAAFESTLLGFGSGIADAVTQQVARFDNTKYDVNDEGKLEEAETGRTIEEILEQTKGKDRVGLWEQYNNAGDDIRDAVEVSQFAEQRGSGSISTELAEGNIANAAQLTVNQTAGGLASLVPFLIPGGQIVGPLVLGGSVVGSSFEEDLESQGDAAINDIYNASYLKGGVELASEFVTAGIIGRAKKMAAGGASAKAVKEMSRSAFSRIMGDAASEGLSEGAADFGSRVVDSAIYGDDIDWKEAAVGFIDSAIVGAIVGGKVATYGEFANPDAKKAQQDKVKSVIANTLSPDSVKADIQDKAKTVIAAEQVIADADPNSLIGQAKIKAAQEQQGDALQYIKEAQDKQAEALKNATPTVLKQLAEKADQVKQLESSLKEIHDVKGKEAEVEVLEDAIQKATEEHRDLWNVNAYQKEIAEGIEFQEKNLNEAIEESDATIEQIQLSDNGMTKQNKLTLKKAKERKKKNQKLKKELNDVRNKIIPNASSAVVKAAKEAGVAARQAAKEAGFDKTYQANQGRQAKNESIIKDINSPDSSFATKQRAESEFLKENAALVTKIRDSFKRSNFDLEALNDSDINSVIQTELLRRAKNYDPSKGKLGKHLTEKLYNKVANTILNKDKKSRNKNRLKDEVNAEQQEEIDYIKSLGLDPDQEANEIANIKQEFAPKFTSLEQGGYEGDPIQVALDEELTDDIFTETEEDTETDTAYVPETASDATRASIAKAYELVDTDIQKIKNEITDGLQNGSIVLPTGKDQRALMTGLRKKAAKTINKKIDNVIGKNSKTDAGLEAASNKILGNTEQIFSLLPKGAKDARRFNGLFTNGNPTTQEWEDYFFAPGRQGYTHRKRLKEALAENALAQYVDEVVKEYPDFSEEWFADKPVRSEKAAVIEIISRQFPDVKIYNTIKSIKDRLRAVGIDPARYTQINGMLSGNAVFLNPDSSSTETLIHEFGHIWVKDIRRSNPALYNRGVKLMSESAWYQRILEASRDPKSLYYNYSSQKIMEEAMATAIGQRGEGLFKYKTQGGLLSKWKEFMTEFKAIIAKQLGINRDQNLETLDKSDFIDIAVTDILSGKKGLTEKERMIADGFEFSAKHENPNVQEAIDELINQMEEYDQENLDEAYGNAYSYADGILEEREDYTDDEIRWAEVMIDNLAEAQEYLENQNNTEFSVKDDIADLKNRIENTTNKDAKEHFQAKLARLEEGRKIVETPNTKVGSKEGTKMVFKKALSKESIKYPNSPLFKTSVDFVLNFSPKFQGRILNSLNVRTHRSKDGVSKNDLYSEKTGLNNPVLWQKLAELNPDIKGLQELANKNYSNKYISEQTIGGKDFQNIFGKVLDHLNGRSDYNDHNTKIYESETNEFLTELGYALSNLNNKTDYIAIKNLLSGLNEIGKVRGDATPLATQNGVDSNPSIKEHTLPFTEFMDNLAKDPTQSEELIKDYVQIDLLKDQDDRINKAGLRETMPEQGDKYGTDINERKDKLKRLGLPTSLVRYFNKAVTLDPYSITIQQGEHEGKTLGEVAPFLDLYNTEFSLNSTPSQNRTRENLVEILERQLSDPEHVYSGSSPYKKSKIDGRTKDLLHETRQDFLKHKGEMSTPELLQLSQIINQYVRDGKGNRKRIADEKTAKRKEVKEQVNKIIKEHLGVDPENVTADQIKQLQKNREGFISNLKKGKIGLALSKMLAPTWNNDLYGLLYDLLPDGKDRETVKSFIKENLTDPLEKAELEHITRKQRAVTDYNNLAEAVGAETLNAESSIEHAGNKLSNSQVVKIYNYLKDPNLYTQLNKGGIDYSKMKEIVRYMNANPELAQFATGVTELYSNFQTDLNNKLDEHNYETVTAPSIDIGKMDPRYAEVIQSILGPNTTQGMYTPLTARGSQEGIDIDAALDGNAHKGFTSVMAGNLKSRSGGGEFTIDGTNVLTDYMKYLDGPVRTMSFLDFADNASAFFNANSMKGLEGALGQGWTDAMKDHLRRTITGKTEQARSTPESRGFTKWLNWTVGGVMFFNTRSAILQLISIWNYWVENPAHFSEGGKKKNKALRKKMGARIKDSAWVKNRAQGKTDVILDEIFNESTEGNNKFERTIDKAIKKGYTLTKLGDMQAILRGGVKWSTGYAAELMENGMTEEEAIEAAYTEFVAKAEETQQSARQSRLGKSQTTPFGKVFLAFQNTPMQYARKVSRALRDINAEGTSPARKKQAKREARYYGIAAPTIFAGLQQMVVSALWSDDDEKNRESIVQWLMSFIHTNMSGAGAVGVLASSVLDIVTNLVKDGHISGDDAVNIMINSSPAIGTKARQIKKAFDGSYPSGTISNALGKDEYKWLTRGASAADLTGVPLSRVLYILEQAVDSMSMLSQGLVGPGVLRLAGWSNYSLDSPLDRGETGQAFADGTIEVDPNLSPEERAKTIAHEKQHVEDMKKNGLDYDDNNVYWKGTAFKRKNGKINYNGKWKKEGDRSFPWEAHAYEAESPLARTGKDKKKEDEKYIRNPEHIEQVNKSRDRFEQHYSDPVTEELYRQNTGFNDLSGRVDNALDTRIQTGFVPQGAKATYDPAIGDYEGAITVEDYRDPAVVDHELTHAAGFDEALGKEAQKILGKPKSGNKYLSKPSELYGNLHEFRAKLDLKGFERNMSPKRVKELIKFNELKDDPDINQMIDEFGLDKLSEALNKIASNRKKPTLEGLYS